MSAARSAQAVARPARLRRVPTKAGLRYINRELSWLDFNARVLSLAGDEKVPLLERAKFLAIFSSNLDEFFMIRVAGLKRRIATGIAVRSAAGLEPREVLEKISEVAGQLQRIQARYRWNLAKVTLARAIGVLDPALLAERTPASDGSTR